MHGNIKKLLRSFCMRFMKLRAFCERFIKLHAFRVRLHAFNKNASVPCAFMKICVRSACSCVRFACALRAFIQICVRSECGCVRFACVLCAFCVRSVSVLRAVVTAHNAYSCTQNAHNSMKPHATARGTHA